MRLQRRQHEVGNGLTGFGVASRITLRGLHCRSPDPANVPGPGTVVATARQDAGIMQCPRVGVGMIDVTGIHVHRQAVSGQISRVPTREARFWMAPSTRRLKARPGLNGCRDVRSRHACSQRRQRRQRCRCTWRPTPPAPDFQPGEFTSDDQPYPGTAAEILAVSVAQIRLWRARGEQ